MWLGFYEAGPYSRYAWNMQRWHERLNFFKKKRHCRNRNVEVVGNDTERWDKVLISVTALQ